MSIVAATPLTLLNNLVPSTINLGEEVKQLAQQAVDSTPLPTTRDEAWKYTRVSKIGKRAYSNVTSTVDSIEKYIIDSNAVKLVFVNGHFNSDHSDELNGTGISVSPLSACNVEDLPKSALQLTGELFHAINTRYLTDGVFIRIDKNAVVDQKIQIIHIVKGKECISNFRTIVEAGDFSKASIIQSFFAEDAENGFVNNISEFHIGTNAHFTIDKVQYESEDSTHLCTDRVVQQKDSTFTINTMTLNGGLVRNNLHIDVDGQNCTTNLNGAYLLKNKQHVDNHTTVDHKVANCESNELYKGVIDDNSTAVFNGKVFVRQDAQKINAFQSNGNVLLSDNASINSKPELEIYADDVKCSHGSTTGQLDEEAVFYLRARGLSEKSARQLMVSAFIGEVIEQIEDESVVNYIHNLLKERFNWAID